MRRQSGAVSSQCTKDCAKRLNAEQSETSSKSLWPLASQLLKLTVSSKKVLKTANLFARFWGEMAPKFDSCSTFSIDWRNSVVAQFWTLESTVPSLHPMFSVGKNLKRSLLEVLWTMKVWMWAQAQLWFTPMATPPPWWPMPKSSFQMRLILSEPRER